MSWNSRIVGSDMVDPSILCPNPKNWRRHPKYQQEAMTNVFNEIGWIQDIIVNKTTGNIIDGHMRAELAIKNKEKLVPVKYVDLTPDEERQALISYDPLSALAEQDNDMLKQLLGDISNNIDMSKFDFGKDVLNSMRPYTDEEINDVPPVPDTPTTKHGDIYHLGNHVLMCGDSTSAEDVGKLMGGAKEVSVLTDPPYNIGFKYNAIDDKMPKSEYKTFCEAFFKNIVDAGAKGIIITPGPRNEEFYPKPKDRGIWVKRNATAGASVFHLRLCEPILFYGTFKEKRNTDLFEYSTGFTQELKDARIKSGVLEEHAPVKPIALWSDLINMLSDGVVLDLFSGNGTTLIACEQLNRICYGMELSPQYCDVIINRWEKLTGKKAELVSEVD